MPFVTINIEEEIEKRRNENPKFRKAWDESRAEYELIGEMIAFRREKQITKKQLATITGIKKQEIARIERKESIPTIRTFSKLLNALGYELRIVKKENI
nr:MAG TPA: Helix-turn-helix XRE-family like protein [Bacteriophage sp.]